MEVSFTNQMKMIYEGNSWHASLRDLLRSVTAEQAAWRPEQGGHTIHEILNHLTYSATEVTSRFRTGEAGWDEAASWVTTPPAFTDAEWESAIARHEVARDALAAAINNLSEEALSAKRNDGRPSFRDMAQQVIHHEAFHAGQIALLRRLQQQAALM